jgi:hypothetical protein
MILKGENNMESIIIINNVPHKLIDMFECSDMWEASEIEMAIPYEILHEGTRYARYVSSDGTHYASPVLQMHSGD